MARISEDEFSQRVADRFPDESFTVEEYSGMGHPLTIKCNSCNTEIRINRAANFLTKSKAHGCKYCQSNFIKKRNELLKQVEERYIVLDKFQKVPGEHYLYKIQCRNCGHIRTTHLKNLEKNLECGCITGVFRRSPEEFKVALRDRKNDEYELMSEYINMSTPVSIKHKKCGYIWNVRPADLLYERSSNCPHCRLNSGSKNSLVIYDTLYQLQIPFDMEKTLKDCRLRFDYYFQIGKQKCAIEYNGIQHYEYTPIYHKNGIEDLKTQQEWDKRKQVYCKENDILMLVIPYTYTREEIKSHVISFVQDVQRLQ